MPLKGYKQTHSHREKVSRALKGRIGFNKGKKFSELWKKRLSLSHKGQIPWNKGKKSLYSKRKLYECIKCSKLLPRKRKTGLCVKCAKRRPKTKEHKEKTSLALKGKQPKNSVDWKGKNHPHWKGGISFEPYSIDWTETLKRSIRERDNYTCRICNSYGNTVHHIDYNKKNCNPINLITLCTKCHFKTNHNRRYWKQYFKQYADNQK